MSPPPSARRLAMQVLRRVEREEAFSNRALADALERHPGLDPRDRGLVTTLVYGVLRHRARLDHLVDNCADRPKKIKGELRVILRLAAYELRELERAAHVVGAEYGRLVKRLQGGVRLVPLTTAIVRHLDRRGAKIDAEAAGSEPVSALTQRWSLPAWLARRWVERLGPEPALARARVLAEPPPLDLRIDASRTKRAQVVERLRAELPGARFELPENFPHTVRVRGGGDVFYGPAHDEGLVSVQSLGSQRAVAVLDPQPGERVLDACCGLGTKTLQLAEHMQRRGHIVATDTHGARLAALEEIRQRGALDESELELEVYKVDLREFEADPFDAVLLDAPCSGLGDLARHPELRERAREDDLERQAERQKTLLTAAARLLGPGGRLVYSVCSLEPEEGSALVGALAEDLGLELESSEEITPEAQQADGFFVARMRALGGSDA